MHVHRSNLAVGLMLAIAAAGLLPSPAGAADQIILGKALVVKDPQPGKVLVQGSLGAITVAPPASGTDGGMRFSITGGDAYCVNFGDAAGGLVKNAPASGVANKLFKIVSTARTASVAIPIPVRRRLGV